MANTGIARMIVWETAWARDVRSTESVERDLSAGCQGLRIRNPRECY